MQAQTHRFARTLAVSLAAAALAAPAAGARPAGPDPVDPGSPPVVESIDGGFDFASAAIGAGGAGALILLVSVGGTAYRRRHGEIADSQVGVTR
jgi:hypothetical protein